MSHSNDDEFTRIVTDGRGWVCEYDPLVGGMQTLCMSVTGPRHNPLMRAAVARLFPGYETAEPLFGDNSNGRYCWVADEKDGDDSKLIVFGFWSILNRHSLLYLGSFNFNELRLTRYTLTRYEKEFNVVVSIVPSQVRGWGACDFSRHLVQVLNARRDYLHFGCFPNLRPVYVHSDSRWKGPSAMERDFAMQVDEMLFAAVVGLVVNLPLGRIRVDNRSSDGKRVLRFYSFGGYTGFVQLCRVEQHSVQMSVLVPCLDGYMDNPVAVVKSAQSTYGEHMTKVSKVHNFLAEVSAVIDIDNKQQLVNFVQTVANAKHSLSTGQPTAVVCTAGVEVRKGGGGVFDAAVPLELMTPIVKYIFDCKDEHIVSCADKQTTETLLIDNIGEVIISPAPTGYHIALGQRSAGRAVKKGGDVGPTEVVLYVEDTDYSHASDGFNRPICNCRLCSVE